MAPAVNPILKAVGPGTTHASHTLYERMGGEAKLEAVVDGVYKLMRDDKEIGKQFARFRLERLKDRTVDYLRGEFGGTKYQGSDLWISHSHMGVTNHWYDIMMGYYVKMLKKERIGKQETKEILESLEKMREPICDPGLKLKEMYLQHCQKEAAKSGGDGWGKVSASKKERDAKELETLTLLTRQRVAETAQDKRGNKPEERAPVQSEVKMDTVKTGKEEPEVKVEKLKTGQEQPGRKSERLKTGQEQPDAKVERLKTGQEQSESQVAGLKPGQEQPDTKVERLKTGQEQSESQVARLKTARDGLPDPPLPPPLQPPARAASRGNSRSRRRLRGHSSELEEESVGKSKSGSSRATSRGTSRRPSSQKSPRKDADVKSHSSTITRQSTFESSFEPHEDAPPAPVPSSTPSGAELLYRLSNPPQKLCGGLFDFCPAFDKPPEEVPSSNPSGAEQLYRFALVRQKSSSLLLAVAG